MNKYSKGIEKKDGLMVALQIVMENSGGALKLKIMELGGGESEEPLAPLISEILSSEPQITVNNYMSLTVLYHKDFNLTC